MKPTTKRLYFNWLVANNPIVNEVVSNDPLDFERGKEYVSTYPEWSRSDSIGSSYFYVPPEFNAIGKTYRECITAGCIEITKEEDL
jgi:hypothetical protein